MPAGMALPADGSDGCLGLWTTAEHVGSMARPTTDDNITVYDDAALSDSETQKTCVWTRQALPALGMLGRGTQ